MPVVTRIIDIRDNELVDFQGSSDEYLARKEEARRLDQMP